MLDWPFRTPLYRFPLIDTKAPDDVRDMLVNNFRARGFDLRRAEPEFRGLANHLRLRNLDLTFSSCTAASRSVLPEVDMVKQRFVLRGNAKTTFGNTIHMISRSESGAIPAGVEAKYENEAGYAEYIFRIDAAALRTKLSAMIGTPVAGPIAFKAPATSGHPEQARLRRLIDHVVAELDGADLPAEALSQYEQSLMVCFLFANRHNFSDALEREQPRPAKWQIARAEDYIEANYSLPLTLEALAEIAGTSALAVSDAFRTSRDVSPFGFLKRVQLKYARRMLQAPEEKTSVTAVACRFGFNPARFARDYQRTFGELPSATLAAARRKRS